MTALSSANALVSGIIAADVESVWGKVKAFTSIQDFILPTGGQRLISEILVNGPPEGSIGCVRVITIGGSSYCERLRALDNHEHTLKYDLISHEGATNPFPGSFLNNVCEIMLRPVTVGSRPQDGQPCQQTFMQWSAAWNTEPEAVPAMEAAIEAWLVSALRGLDMYVCSMSRNSSAHSQGRESASASSVQEGQPSGQYMRSSQGPPRWTQQTPRSTSGSWDF